MTRKSRAITTAYKLGELGLAAPQVIAHRVARMAIAGPTLSARDRKEFTAMVLEKQKAFAESWMAMFAEGVRVQQSLLTSWFGNPGRRQSSQLRNAFLRVTSKGLAPVHRKAVANSRRLARTKLR